MIPEFVYNPRPIQKQHVQHLPPPRPAYLPPTIFAPTIDPNLLLFIQAAGGLEKYLTYGT